MCVCVCVCVGRGEEGGYSPVCEDSWGSRGRFKSEAHAGQRALKDLFATARVPPHSKNTLSLFRGTRVCSLCAVFRWMCLITEERSQEQAANTERHFEPFALPSTTSFRRTFPVSPTLA